MKERARRKKLPREEWNNYLFKNLNCNFAPAFVTSYQVVSLIATLRWSILTFSRCQIKNRLVGGGRSTPAKMGRLSMVKKGVLFVVAVSSVCPGACERFVQLHLDCRQLSIDSWLLQLLRRLHGYLSHVGTTVDRHTVGFYGCVHPTSEVILYLGQRRKRQGPRHRRPREHATHSLWGYFPT